MVKYIGSKRALLPWITDTVTRVHALSPLNVVADIFSGSARVGHALKAAGFEVVSNDILHFAYTLAKALVEADQRDYPEEKIKPILQRLETTPPLHGWFVEKYCQEAHYFQPKNGAKIQAIREAIEEESRGDPLLRSILITSLILAADKVDSTVGVQMAYLKSWAPRSYNDLKLEYPPLLPGKGKAIQEDAVELVRSLDVDLIYIDPPYNQHSYLGNYHIWETVALWDAPPTYGKANKRVDVRERKSPFNQKQRAKEAFKKLIEQSKSKHLLVSFNDEGFLTENEIKSMLSEWGYTLVFRRPHSRYIGHKIGVYNPQGERVGEEGPSKNLEYLFLSTQERRVYEALLLDKSLAQNVGR